MVDEILISTERGIVTQQDIDCLIDEYISTLYNPELLQKNVQCFNGLLDYIFRHKLNNIIGNPKRYDITLLDTIFSNIYVPLCYMYGYTVNVLYYCILVHIDYDHITDIVHGVYRNNGNIVNKELQNVIKKWFKAQEASLTGQAVQGNGVGAIFALKAMHQWQDTQTVQIQAAEPAQQLTVDELEQIAQQEQPPEEPEIDNI